MLVFRKFIVCACSLALKTLTFFCQNSHQKCILGHRIGSKDDFEKFENQPLIWLKTPQKSVFSFLKKYDFDQIGVINRHWSPLRFGIQRIHQKCALFKFVHKN